MNLEYAALLFNKTWTLVPYVPCMHVVGNKWVFGTKYKDDGSIESFKAHLVAKGFH